MRTQMAMFIQTATLPGVRRPPLKKIDTAIQNLIYAAHSGSFFDVQRCYLEAKNAIISFINPTAPLLSNADRIRISPFPEAKTPLDTCLINAFQSLEVALSDHHPSLYFPPIAFADLHCCQQQDFCHAIGLHSLTFHIYNPRLWDMFTAGFHQASRDTQTTLILKLSDAIPKSFFNGSQTNPILCDFVKTHTQRLWETTKKRHPFPSDPPYLSDIRKHKYSDMMAAVGLNPMTYTIQNTSLWSLFREDLEKASPREARLTATRLSTAILQKCLRNNTSLALLPEITHLFNQFTPLQWQIYENAGDVSCLRDPITQRMSLPLPTETEKWLKKGAYGKIFLGKSCTNDEIVIKHISLNSKAYLTNVESLFNEVQLSQVPHPNILAIQKAFIASDALGIPTAYLTMPYCSEGSLEGFVFSETAQTQAIWLSHKTQWEDELVDAVATLHEHNIAHSDIKLGNVLVVTDATGRHHTKLTDFGFSAYFSDESRHSTSRGTSYITPPEVINHALLILPEKRDMWHLGITLFEINTGQSFTRRPRKAIPKTVLQFCWNHSFRDSVLELVDPPATRQGLAKVLVASPTARISARTLQNTYLRYRQHTDKLPPKPQGMPVSHPKINPSIWNLDSEAWDSRSLL